MQIKRVVKVTLFCVIFLLLFHRVYTILSWKDTAGDYYSSVDSFYELEEDIVDVMFFGSSRCYCSIDHSVLWNKHGISSFSLSISGQDFAGTYYTLKEALKTQSPEVVFVELYGAVFDGYQVEGNLYRTTLPFKLSRNAYELVDNLVEEEERKTDFWLRWPIFHTRYAELKKEDFQTDLPVYLGYQADFTTQPIAGIEIYEGDEVTPLPEKREKWLRKIIDLAEDAGTQLCFFIAPYEIREAHQKLFHAVEEIAQEHDIPLLNMSELKEELKLNIQEDFSDWAHTNHYGAQKVSKYIGKFLAEHYDLEDHRGDERYALWEENSRVRSHEVQNQQLKSIHNVGGYLDILSCMEDYVVVISTAGDHLNSEADISDYLQTLGVDKAFYEASGGAWVLDNGELVYASAVDDSFYHLDLGYGDLLVSRAGGVNSVIVDKAPYKTVEDGINIMVYDKILGRVVDRVGFSAPSAYGIAR